MIDVWILTVVVHSESGVTSYQLKFYSEQEAKNEEEKQLQRLYSESYITSITETKEHNNEILPFMSGFLFPVIAIIAFFIFSLAHLM